MKGFDAVVTTCIVNDGGIEVASVKPFDDGGQTVGVVRGGNEADHILGLWQKAGYLVHDGIDTDKAWGGVTRADLMVLAVDALEVAMGEKNVADAPCAA